MAERVKRIPATKLIEAAISTTLFDKTRFSGMELARRTETTHNTFWTFFFRRGLPLDKASQVADILVEWAQELLVVSARIRALAAEAETQPIPQIMRRTKHDHLREAESIEARQRTDEPQADSEAA